MSTKCYTSIHNLPCSVYWDICVNGDTSQLIIEGECDNTDEIWADIIAQNAELISEDAKVTRAQQHQAMVHGCKAMWVANAVLYLRKDYHHDLTTKLKAMFQGIKLDIEDPFKFHKDLDRCVAIAKTWQFEADRIEGVLRDMYEDKKAKSGGAATLEMFYGTLIHMSDFKGYRLDANELSVFEYGLHYKQMKAAKRKQDVRNGK